LPILAFLRRLFGFDPAERARRAAEKAAQRRELSAQLVIRAQQFSLFDFGERGRARSYVHEAMRLDPTNIEAKQLTAKLLMQGDAKTGESAAEAIPILNELIAFEPSDPKYWLMRGIAHSVDLAEGSKQRALDDFAEVIRLDPAFDGGHGPCAAFKHRLQILRSSNPELALAEIEQAMTHCPDDDDLFAVRAYMRLARGDFDGAIADAGEAIRRKPDASSYTRRAEFFQKRGDLDRAVADLTTAIELDPSLGPYEQRGNVYEQKGDLAAALADFDRVGVLRGQSSETSFYSWAVSYRRVRSLLDKQ
jgi:tetratricopeptide (TPR) repeat protein